MAGNTLVPEDGYFKPVAELLDRLRREFGDKITIDKTKGRESVLGSVAYMKRLRDRGNPRYSDEDIAELESKADESYWVCIYDPDVSREWNMITTLVPDEDIVVGYSSPEEQDAVRPLLERFARAIEYDIDW